VALAQKELPRMESPRRRDHWPQMANKSSVREPVAAELPDRYAIRRKGEERELVCSESPTIAVRIERGMTVADSAARKAPPGTIYLDGAAEGGPFLDVEKGLFNLDHHEGCVRSFTLATCEQAMVMVRKGMDLQRRDWTIYSNDPDLDTVLAIWVLLNHMRLNDADPEIRRKVMPLVRLEGTIDAHGLEMQELCGFPQELEKSIFAELEGLRSKEVALKKDGKWQEIDFLEYTANLLRAIDAMIYSSHHFEGVLEVEELARAEIGESQLAIVCRGEAGIYEVEAHLRRLHGKRLGVIILQKSPDSYTLRQVDAFLPARLESAYERLNLIDPAAGNRRSGNRWGGSGEIGGSPRATGTALTPQQIAAAVAQAYRRPTRAQRLATLAVALLENTAVMMGSIGAIYLLGWLRDPAGSIEGYFLNQAGIYAGVLIAFTGVLAVATLKSGPKLFGLSMPTGLDWLVLLPGALLGGLAGGAWIFTAPLVDSHALLESPWTGLAIAVGFPVVAEVLFRGLMHGTLAQRYPIQRHGGPWFLSWPILISSTLYALWSLLPFLPFFPRGVGLTYAGVALFGISSGMPVVLTYAGALLFGISSGMARERSESLLPCLILHWFCLLLFLMMSFYR
jgi:Type II CAAX prenyl endopeptidase Rce1-like